MRIAKAAATLLVLLSIGVAPARGQNTPDLVGNQLTLSVQGRQSYDSTTGLYTYSYSVSNATTSLEEVQLFAVTVGGLVMPDVVNPTAPTGWTVDVHTDRPIVSWGATDLSGALPDGSNATPPSTYQIKPGQQLAGFSFQSHAGPGSVAFYGQGYVRGPLAEPGDADDEHAIAVPDFTQIGVNGRTLGPVSTALSGSPSVRGFVAILTPNDGDTLSSPVQIQLKFAIDGENVDPSTFHAALNGIDVTNSFAAGGSGDLQAGFSLGGAVLQSGSNDFVATVSGTDPQTMTVTQGVSRRMFTVATTIPGDLNGDGVVNCADLAMLRASFGLKVGQSGFDPRADVNGDGIIDVRDLAFVSQKLPAGTKCP